MSVQRSSATATAIARRDVPFLVVVFERFGEDGLIVSPSTSVFLLIQQETLRLVVIAIVVVSDIAIAIAIAIVAVVVIVIVGRIWKHAAAMFARGR